MCLWSGLCICHLHTSEFVLSPIYIYPVIYRSRATTSPVHLRLPEELITIQGCAIVKQSSTLPCPPPPPIPPVLFLCRSSSDHLRLCSGRVLRRPENFALVGPRRVRDADGTAAPPPRWRAAASPSSAPSFAATTSFVGHCGRCRVRRYGTYRPVFLTGSDPRFGRVDQHQRGNQ